MHVMLDMETLALSPDAVILQVGMVEFEPVRGGKVEVDGLCIFVDIDSQVWRKINGPTLLWWMDQSDAARRHIIEGHSLSLDLETTLTSISEWLDTRLHEFDYLWSKGADFDVAILKHAFMDNKLPVPWHYRQARCLRTHFDYNPLSSSAQEKAHDRAAKILDAPLVKHDAIHDAVIQACEFQAAL